MLAAGMVPGILLTIIFCTVIAGMGWFVYDYPRGERLTVRARLRVILGALPTLSIPIVIVGSILSGIANPTEAAAVGAVAAILVGRFWIGELSVAQLPRMLLRAGIYS